MRRIFVLGTMAAVASCLSVPAIAQKAGETIYKQKCAMCHGADGEGNTPAGKMLKVVSFESPAIKKKSDAELIEATKKGKGKMPEFGTKLSDSQVKEAIAYIRTLEKK
jgi:cytochrome c6